MRSSAGEKNLARTIRRWIIGVLLGTVILVIGSFLIWRMILGSRINASFARMKTVGYPTNPKELNQWYREVPTNENAALLFLAGAREISKAGSRLEGEIIDWVTTNRMCPIPPELTEGLNLRLTANQSALARLHEAGANTRSRYPIDFIDLSWNGLEHLGKLETAASLLEAESIQFSEAGKFDEAAESARVIFLLSESLAEEPTLVSQFTRFGILRKGCTAVQQALNAGPVGAPALRALMAALERADDVAGLQRALAGERAMDIPVFRMEGIFLHHDQDDPPIPIDEETKRWLEAAAKKSVRRIGLLERDLRFYLDTMERNLAMLALCEPQNLAATNYVAAQALRARSNYCLISMAFLWPLDRAIAGQANHAARVRVARAALAIEIFRADHNGERPPTLDVLVPAYVKQIPKDPFNGQPLRYILRSTGYVVYSIGADGKDDQGKERPRKLRTGETFDIPLSVDR